MSYYDTIIATQKSGRAANRQAGKPAAEKRAKNPCGKTRDKTNPYAWWVDPHTGWKFVLLKSYQYDNAKQHARWFLWVEGNYSEYGDEYAYNVRGALNRAMSVSGYASDGSIAEDNQHWGYDTTIWERPGQFAAWAWGER